jgi:hypothetical protein
MFAACFAFWVGVAALLFGCAKPPNPKVISYEVEAELCAQAALHVDAGVDATVYDSQAAKYRYYDACEHEAYRRAHEP